MEYRELKAERAAAEKDGLWKGNDWDLMFTTSTGTPINPRNLQTTFDALLKWAGLPKVRLHDLRHSIASLLMAQGVSLALVSRYIRHANIKTTMDQYGHLSVDDLAPVTEAIQNLIGTETGTVKPN